MFFFFQQMKEELSGRKGENENCLLDDLFIFYISHKTDRIKFIEKLAILSTLDIDK